MSWLLRAARARSERMLRRAPPEFLLLCACCRWPAGEARDKAVRDAVNGLDWRLTMRLAGRHRIWGRVRDGLAQAGVSAPASFDESLDARSRALARRSLLLSAETARLSLAFEKADVEALFVKGATLEALVYRDVSLKHSFDIDVLVAPDQVLNACQLLDKMGYAQAPPRPPLSRDQLALLLRHCREWEFRRADGVVVELHWRVAYNSRLVPTLTAGAPRQTIPVAGALVPTFAREELFVYLCVHGAQHSWSRLKWLADLAAFVAEAGNEEQLFLAAQEAGAGRCAAQALLLCERLFGLDLPPALSARLHDDAGAALLEALALEAMLGGGATTEYARRASHGALAFVSLGLLGSTREFLAEEVRRYLIAPSDVAALRLPKSLAWLYVPLRVPMWALRRLLKLRR